MTRTLFYKSLLAVLGTVLAVGWAHADTVGIQTINAQGNEGEDLETVTATFSFDGSGLLSVAPIGTASGAPYNIDGMPTFDGAGGGINSVPFSVAGASGSFDFTLNGLEGIDVDATSANFGVGTVGAGIDVANNGAIGVLGTGDGNNGINDTEGFQIVIDGTSLGAGTSVQLSGLDYIFINGDETAQFVSAAGNVSSVANGLLDLSGLNLVVNSGDGPTVLGTVFGSHDGAGIANAANFRVDAFQLDINFTAVPEPTSLGLLAFGSLAFFARRRRG